MEVDDPVSRAKSNAIRQRNPSSDSVNFCAEHAIGTLRIVEHRVAAAEPFVQCEDNASKGTLTKLRFCIHRPLRDDTATPG